MQMKQPGEETIEVKNKKESHIRRKNKILNEAIIETR